MRPDVPCCGVVQALSYACRIITGYYPLDASSIALSPVVMTKNVSGQCPWGGRASPGCSSGLLIFARPLIYLCRLLPHLHLLSCLYFPSLCTHHSVHHQGAVSASSLAFPLFPSPPNFFLLCYKYFNHTFMPCVFAGKVQPSAEPPQSSLWPLGHHQPGAPLRHVHWLTSIQQELSSHLPLGFKFLTDT